MKLSATFARYLYQRKKLDLPGIGTFSIDPSVPVPDPADKAYPDFLQHIKYEQNPVQLADPDLIDFIRTETGKIKPLAESDLESFLSDGKILLNIGKPFHIEGIGLLVKAKSGKLEFTPGETAVARLEGFYNEPMSEESGRKRITHEDTHTQSNGARKALIAVALIGGLVLIVWGGYSLYNRNTTAQSATTPDTATVTPAPGAATRSEVLLDTVQKIIDSTKQSLQAGNDATAPASSTASSYRFVIERTANKDRALKRFQQLKDAHTGVLMETPDSLMFSLYFTIPSTAADTTRIKDSLRIWYGRKQVFVEHD